MAGRLCSQPSGIGDDTRVPSVIHTGASLVEACKSKAYVCQHVYYIRVVFETAVREGFRLVRAEDLSMVMHI